MGCGARRDQWCKPDPICAAPSHQPSGVGDHAVPVCKGNGTGCDRAGGPSQFVDAGKVAGWAEAAVAWALKRGNIGGLPWEPSASQRQRYPRPGGCNLLPLWAAVKKEEPDMKRMNRVLSLLLVLCMIATLLPAQVLATDGEQATATLSRRRPAAGGGFAGSASSGSTGGAGSCA